MPVALALVAGAASLLHTVFLDPRHGRSSSPSSGLPASPGQPRERRPPRKAPRPKRLRSARRSVPTHPMRPCRAAEEARQKSMKSDDPSAKAHLGRRQAPPPGTDGAPLALAKAAGRRYPSLFPLMMAPRSTRGVRGAGDATKRPTIQRLLCTSSGYSLKTFRAGAVCLSILTVAPENRGPKLTLRTAGGGENNRKVKASYHNLGDLPTPTMESITSSGSACSPRIYPRPKYYSFLDQMLRTA